MSRTHAVAPRAVRAMRGFSIVELMVAMTLSLILMAGALSILYSSKLTYTENEHIARLQEAGRTVIEMILRDARGSGFDGCTHPLPPPPGGLSKFQNRLLGSTNLLRNYEMPVGGFEATSSSAWTPTLPATDFPAAIGGSDVLVIRTSPLGSPTFRTDAPIVSPTATISVARPSGATVAARTPMIISDCEYSSVFIATTFTPGTATTATISHAGGGADPQNADSSLLQGFKVDAIVLPLQTVSYFVATSGGGNGPALFRKVGEAAPQELIPGVENLQVIYGELNAVTNIVSQVRANAVTNWNNVVSITIAVLVRSETQGGVEKDVRTYSLMGANGATLGPFTDRRQRSVFTTTVVLRNRST